MSFAMHIAYKCKAGKKPTSVQVGGAKMKREAPAFGDDNTG
jgi:hypothetical protein